MSNFRTAIHGPALLSCLVLAAGAGQAATVEPITVADVTIVDELGFSCIREDDLERAFSASGKKGSLLPQTCLPRPCERQIGADELAERIGRDPTEDEWADYVARYAETCVAETGGAWPDDVMFASASDPLTDFFDDLAGTPLNDGVGSDIVEDVIPTSPVVASVVAPRAVGRALNTGVGSVVNGTVGRPGGLGSRGLAGLPGLPGISGSSGSNGSDGSNGANGSNGNNGSNGSDGSNGSNGVERVQRLGWRRRPRRQQPRHAADARAASGLHAPAPGRDRRDVRLARHPGPRLGPLRSGPRHRVGRSLRSASRAIDGASRFDRDLRRAGAMRAGPNRHDVRRRFDGSPIVRRSLAGTPDHR